MRGQQGKLKRRDCCDEAKIQLRLVVDDAHGFGTLGKQELEQVRNKEFKMILMFTFQLLQNQWLTLVALQLTKTLSTIWYHVLKCLLNHYR
jgi:hypothetical protein